MTAIYMLFLAVELFGDDWSEYFYPEYVNALLTGTSAFNHMSNLKINGCTTSQLLDHHIYGLYINIAEYHPNMDYYCYCLDERINRTDKSLKVDIPQGRLLKSMYAVINA